MRQGKIIPFTPVLDDSEEILEKKSEEELQLDKLDKLIPHICNDVGMLIARPFRFHWDPTRLTAGTDCKAEIFMPPWFFLYGEHEAEVGFGSIYHECGHIRTSPFGCNILEDAYRQGEETRRHIMNLILDRKDDKLLSEDAPGFAQTLWKRLAYISTIAHRDAIKAWFKKNKVEANEEQITKLLKCYKPSDIYEDFFFACKWHKHPRYKLTQRALKYLSIRRLKRASYQELLWIAKRVHEILGDMPKAEKELCEKRFIGLCVLIRGIDQGITLRKSELIGKKISSLLKKYVARIRMSGVKQLIQALHSQGIIHPGPISVGVKSKVPLKKIFPHAKNEREYLNVLQTVQHRVEPFVKKLRQVDNPSEFILHGQDEGGLDLTQTARIAVGLSGIYQETVLERDIDAEIHLAIDCSGSMCGSKVYTAKQIGVVYTEAILALNPMCIGRIWAFSSNAVYDFGPPRKDSGFITANGEGSNSDTHMLKFVGTELAKSPKKRKVLLVICDDGPDNIDQARKLSHQLLARGIIVVHLLVEVHGTPNIFPFELIYDSIEDCLEEFGDLLEKIIRNLK